MEKKDKKEIKTYLGTKYDFEFLRAWIRAPFTLEKHEDKAMRAFINSHIDLKKSDFGWFFEVYWKRDCQLARSEINGLLKLVDKMEAFSKNDLNGLFGECNVEVNKAKAALAFLAPRIKGSNIDKGAYTEFNRLSTSLTQMDNKLNRLEKLILQAYGNVPVKKLLEKKENESDE